MTEFKIASLTEEQKKEVKKHLDFISHVTEESIKHGYRAIIGGGYAVDGVIGQITRPHNDIDIQLYGNDVITPKLLCDSVLKGKYAEYHFEDRGRTEYWHSFFINEIGAEICYIRVAFNPFSESKIVIKSDNTYSEEHDFETKIVILDGVRYEVQNPVQELADKIYKRDYRGDAKLPKHDQDISNLKLITDPYNVDFAIKLKIKQQTS
jgi:hypothetical protein